MLLLENPFGFRYVIFHITMQATVLGSPPPPIDLNVHSVQADMPSFHILSSQLYNLPWVLPFTQSPPLHSLHWACASP